jgi:hypothetical protein
MTSIMAQGTSELAKTHEATGASAEAGAMLSRAREKSRREIAKGTDQVEAGIERGAELVWRSLRKRPMLGVALVAGTGLFMAELVGVGELAFAGALGYGAYQMLKKNKPPAEALRDAMRVEREL